MATIKGLGNMHTIETESIGFHHNDDYSGNVELVLPVSAVEPSPDGSVVAVTVPFDALKAFVAEWVRKEWIESLEQSDPDELLLETKMG